MAALPSSSGAATSLRIVERPASGTVDVAPATPPATDPTSTGPDGVVRITPAPGFVGVTTFQVSGLGTDAAVATITVEVVAAPAPAAADDQIEVERDAVVTIDAAGVARQRPAPELAYSRRPCQAWRSLPRRCVSCPSSASTAAPPCCDATTGRSTCRPKMRGTFTYTVADESGATANARVTVRSAAATTVPTTPTPTPSPTPTTFCPRTLPSLPSLRRG